MQSILNSVIALLEKKSGEANGKNMHIVFSKDIVPFLRKRISASAQKLLTFDLPSEDAENGGQSKVSQKIFNFYFALILAYKHEIIDWTEDILCFLFRLYRVYCKYTSRIVTQVQIRFYVLACKVLPKVAHFSILSDAVRDISFGRWLRI
jgi:hypothetical protein